MPLTLELAQGRHFGFAQAEKQQQPLKTRFLCDALSNPSPWKFSIFMSEDLDLFLESISIPQGQGPNSGHNIFQLTQKLDFTGTRTTPWKANQVWMCFHTWPR